MGLNRNETEREARRVLRHMEGCVLERRGGRFVLVRRRGGRPRLRLSLDGAAAFQAEGWIAPSPEGGLGLTAQGRAFAARAMADSDPFRAQHGAVIDLGGGVKRETAAGVLEMLGRLNDAQGRPYLGETARAAAARLEADFERAHFRPLLTRDLSVLPRGTPFDPRGAEKLNAAALDARSRVMAALDAAGPGIRDMLFEAVCLSQGLSVVERTLGWPPRSGKALLRLGLERLAEHYGLTSGQRPPGRIEAWMQAVAGADAA